MNIVSNCPLCEEHGLHVMGEEDDKLLQCLSCGYVSSTKFIITDSIETNEAYKSLDDDMKKWGKEKDGRIWIPSIITLPTGMLYPVKSEEVEIQWAFARLIEIPDDDQKDYPVGDGNFYKTHEVDILW